MSNDNFDAETNKAIAEADALDAMFKSSGWKVAERELDTMIAELKDITGINPDDDDVKQQIRDRINLSASLEHWKDELMGRIDNARFMAQPKSSDKLITRR